MNSSGKIMDYLMYIPHCKSVFLDYSQFIYPWNSYFQLLWAEEWKKSAQECQEYAHQALHSNWVLSLTGRKPQRPQIEAIPEIYKQVLEPKMRPSHKKNAEYSPDEES